MKEMNRLIRNPNWNKAMNIERLSMTFREHSLFRSGGGPEESLSA